MLAGGQRNASPPGNLLYAGRLATVCFGVVQILVGIVAAGMSRSVVQDALAIASFSAGLLLACSFWGSRPAESGSKAR